MAINDFICAIFSQFLILKIQNNVKWQLAENIKNTVLWKRLMFILNFKKIVKQKLKEQLFDKIFQNPVTEKVTCDANQMIV